MRKRRKSLFPWGKGTSVEKSRERLLRNGLSFAPSTGLLCPKLSGVYWYSHSLYCGRSGIIFIRVKFLVCSNLERKKDTKSVSSSVEMLDWCDPSRSVAGHWQNPSLNLWTIFLCQFFALLREQGMLPREKSQLTLNMVEAFKVLHLCWLFIRHYCN